MDIAGNADFFGAAIGQKVSLRGEAGFHFDEDLYRRRGFEEFQRFARVSWRELSRPAH